MRLKLWSFKIKFWFTKMILIYEQLVFHKKPNCIKCSYSWFNIKCQFIISWIISLLSRKCIENIKLKIMTGKLQSTWKQLILFLIWLSILTYWNKKKESKLTQKPLTLLHLTITLNCWVNCLNLKHFVYISRLQLNRLNFK